MKILLVDDHVSFCEGLVAAISAKRPEIDFSYESHAELVPSVLLEKDQFDLIILDIMMPGLGGIELVKNLNAMGNFVPILIMSSVEDIDIIQSLYALGVLGFMPKYYSVQDIINAIEQCQNGEMHVPSNLTDVISLGRERRSDLQSSSPSKKDNSGVNRDQLKFRLTKRQIEVLSLMDQGLSNQEIGKVLHISLATVKTHIHHVYTIFGVNNRVNCLRAAKKAKIA